MNKILLRAALAGIAAAALSATAQAAEPAKEKCYGIAKAGKNDCHSADGANSCAGQAAKDNDPNNWKFVRKGECEQKGGKLEPAAKAE